MLITRRFYRLLSLLLWSINGVWAATAEDDDWFHAQDVDTDQVNEGRLEFYAQLPIEPVHHLSNTIAITTDSLRSGWVELLQCHTHIDQVSAAQIVFNENNIRNLVIREYSHIESAWVDGASIQLEKVGKSASVCISAETKALHIDGHGGYVLKNGPYMRRFLDGFYPMRVSFKVIGPALLKWVSVTPSLQPGFSLSEEGGTVRIEAVFAGKLNTELRFITD